MRIFHNSEFKKKTFKTNKMSLIHKYINYMLINVTNNCIKFKCKYKLLAF